MIPFEVDPNSYIALLCFLLATIIMCYCLFTSMHSSTITPFHVITIICLILTTIQFGYMAYTNCEYSKITISDHIITDGVMTIVDDNNNYYQISDPKLMMGVRNNVTVNALVMQNPFTISKIIKVNYDKDV